MTIITGLPCEIPGPDQEGRGHDGDVGKSSPGEVVAQFLAEMRWRLRARGVLGQVRRRKPPDPGQAAAENKHTGSPGEKHSWVSSFDPRRPDA